MGALCKRVSRLVPSKTVEPGHPSGPREWTLECLKQELHKDTWSTGDKSWLRGGYVPPAQLGHGTVMLVHVTAAREGGFMVLHLDVDTGTVTVSAKAAPAVQIKVPHGGTHADGVALRHMGVAAFGCVAWAAAVPYMYYLYSVRYDVLLLNEYWVALQMGCAPHVDAQLRLAEALATLPTNAPTVGNVLHLRACVRECLKHGVRAGDPMASAGGEDLLAYFPDGSWKMVVAAAELPAVVCHAVGLHLGCPSVERSVLALFGGNPLCVWQQAVWRPAAHAWAMAQ
jgi:hypothetical protein